MRFGNEKSLTPQSKYLSGDGDFVFIRPDALRSQDLPKDLKLDLGGGVTMELVLIPAGEFQMGSKFPQELADGLPNAHPQHRVRIREPFYIGKH